MTKDEIGAEWDAITPKLYGYLVNTLRDKSLAQDILQTTWLKAIEALPRYKEGGASFSSWLFTIAKNECRQHWRKQGREVSLDLELHDRGERDGATEDKIFIEQALSRMPETDREILKLRYIADLPLGEIAKILKINGVAARVRLHRATISLKTLLKEQ